MYIFIIVMKGSYDASFISSDRRKYRKAEMSNAQIEYQMAECHRVE